MIAFMVKDFKEWPGGISDGLTLACSRCGTVPRFDFGVRDELWNRVVPEDEKRGVICLPCFDRLCYLSGEELAPALEHVQFTGAQATIVLVPGLVIDRTEA